MRYASNLTHLVMLPARGAEAHGRQQGRSQLWATHERSQTSVHVAPAIQRKLDRSDGTIAIAPIDQPEIANRS